MKGISEEITIRELIEWAKRDKLRIEVEIEPSEYGPLRRRITVEPWAPYQPYCPNGFKPEDVYFLKKSDPEKDPDPAEAPVKKLYQVGDLMSFTLTNGRKMRAVAVQQDGDEMIFAALASFMDTDWNEDDTTEGGYKESKIRKTVNTEALALIPPDLRERMRAFTAEENDGDLLTIPSREEIFAEDEMLEGMRDRRNVICMEAEDKYSDWYWLRSVFSASDACLVNGYGDAYTHGASNSLGVRPLFKIVNR